VTKKAKFSATQVEPKQAAGLLMLTTNIRAGLPAAIMKTKYDHEKIPSHAPESPALRSIIARHPFFEHMCDTHLDALTGCAMQTQFSREDFIFHQGDVANRFYLIEDGCVALESNQPGHGTIRIQTLGPGDALGWSWLFPPHIWRFSARVIEPTRAIFFYGTWLRAQFEQHPGLADELMRRMAQLVVERLQATQLQLVEISEVAMRAQLQALQMTVPTEHTASKKN
jgi:CRP/FNR family cyclic AMP-dependent transcriptional regulator